MTPEQLRVLYDRFAPSVYRRGLRWVDRPADAWDVVQEVFRRVFESADGFRGESAPLTYLYRATLNVSLNLLRARAVRERSFPEGTSEPHGQLEQRSEARDLLWALAQRLDERELQIAVLHHVEGLTQEAVAERLGLSRKTVQRELESIRAVVNALRTASAERAP